MEASVAIFRGVMFHKLFKESQNLQLILSQDLLTVLAMNDKAIEYLGLELEEINFQNVSEIIEELEKKFNLIHNSFLFNEETQFHLQFTTKKDKMSEMQIIYKSLHDLKQPVSIIGSFTQLLERKLKKEDKLDDKDKSFLSYIGQGIEQLNHLMKSLAEYSSMQAKIEKLPYALKEVLAEVSLAFQKKFSNGDIEFHSNIETEFITGDKAQLVVLLQKIIANSIRFKSDENKLQITLSAQKQNDKVLISINDNGIGIAEENLDKVFDVYTKFFENDEQKSSGLGLAIAKQIVDNHNGQIWIESTKGIGTTVFMRI